jgi:hypothetical protein
MGEEREEKRGKEETGITILPPEEVKVSLLFHEHPCGSLA